jgi:hypothetical protein
MDRFLVRRPSNARYGPRGCGCNVTSDSKAEDSDAPVERQGSAEASQVCGHGTCLLDLEQRNGSLD